LRLARAGAQHHLCTMANKRFGVGDEVAVRGVVWLVDAGGPGTVTIELKVNG
jgi:hypothetical protein